MPNCAEENGQQSNAPCVLEDILDLATVAHRGCWSNTQKALRLAVEFHSGQFRKTGEPYVSHPIAVARLLLTHGVLDDVILASALLHDVLEDCPDHVSARDLATTHGLDVRVVSIVVVLTKKPGQQASEYYVRISGFPVAALVKIADRCHNLMTMDGAFSPTKIREYVAETEEFVLPLCKSAASRLPNHARAIHALDDRMKTVLTQSLAGPRKHNRVFTAA